MTKNDNKGLCPNLYKDRFPNILGLDEGIEHFGFKNSGLTLEFRFLVGIGRSGVMIGRLCLNMVS